MPTYGYRCDKGHEFEIVQGINDPPLLKCTTCGAPVRRIFYPVGIVFKGPGFYKTDSRGGSGSSIPAGDDKSAPGTGGDKGAEVTKAEPKKESLTPKPASKPESKSTKKPA